MLVPRYSSVAVRKHLVPDTLTHSAGVISAVFGSKTYTIAVGTPTANALNYLYLVVGSGTTTLVQSLSAPSVYRLSAPTAILIGAYYATASATPIFGAFVTIEGAPTTVGAVDDPTGNLGLVTGFSTATMSVYKWNRIGATLLVNFRADSATGNGATAALALPIGTTQIVYGSGAVGTYAGQNGSGNAGGGSIIGTGGSIVNFSGPNLTGSAVSVHTGTQVAGAAGSAVVTGNFRVDIAQWSSTPLKDL